MQAVKKRRKKLTNAEKNMNKRIKQKLQEEGVLPPDKKRLNRKQFALEVLQAVESEDFNFYVYLSDIIQGFSWMRPLRHEGKILRPVTLEQVGALKVLKIAIEIKKFRDGKRTEGISEVGGMEFFETVVKPIIDL